MTAIEWTDVTWNPTRGCRRVSPGCEHCYAERQAIRMSGEGGAYEGLVKLTSKGPRWTGKGRLVPSVLAQPLRWRKPRRVFVDSMSDLFFEPFSFEEIAAVFGVMAACPQHTFQVLTKRPARALEFFNWAASLPTASGHSWRDGAPVVGYLGEYAIKATSGKCNVWLDGALPPWPLPNVILMVSVEDQPRADERIPLLFQCPAAVYGLSVEPMLGPVDLSRYLLPCDHVAWSGDEGPVAALGRMPRRWRCDGCGLVRDADADPPATPGIDWVIGGGESGHGARPMHPDWARALRDQCVGARVPFFFKQWGAWRTIWDEAEDPDGRSVPDSRGNRRVVNLAGGHGFHGDRVTIVEQVGKKIAGRLLDGREWNEVPK